MRQHWFFDFDGTLCDTEADIKSAWRAALRNIGRDCPRFDSVYRTGPTLDQVVYMLFDDATPELVDAVKAQFRTCYDAGGFPATRPYPWVPAWLADLKRQGCRIYVATNKRWNPTRLLMAKFGWDALFDGFYSFDSFLDPAVAAAHPGAPQRFLSKAELLSEIMRLRGIDPADAVMVGDTKGDVVSGSVAGMYTVGCTWGYGTREELEGANEIYDAEHFA
ncbi:MAG: HAD hydrolase-like protein [Kiritimatiellae bacterium]|nr:HAD hydrolase-like protein [Kiritimatiellia bacterium]